jgi:hypothetical protein
MITQINGGVCAAKGFTANGIHCGIRKNKTKRDLALIFSEVKGTAAATYTQNLVKGAPLLVTKSNISDGYAQAMICNSGNANTCNANGVEVAEETMEETTEESEEEPLVPTIIAEEDVTEDAPVEETPEAEVLPPVVAEPAEAAPAHTMQSSEADADKPYKVVEKVVTETYKEVIKETTTTTTTPATEELLKAIAELMKISSQIRASQEMAVENPSVKNDESIPAIADAEDEDEDTRSDRSRTNQRRVENPQNRRIPAARVRGR